MFGERDCGVYFSTYPQGDTWGVKTWLPLLSLSVKASIFQSSTNVTLKQSFSNPDADKPITEAAYTFPMYESASVVAFKCKIGDRTIQGFVQEKDKARRTYEAARDRGESAGLLIQNTPDVWSTKIGNIPAGGTVDVEIGYVCELKHDSQVDGIRFVLPTCIAPRYGDAPAERASGVDHKSKGIKIVVEVTMTSPISSVQSPSHPIDVGIGTHNPGHMPSRDVLDVCKAHALLSQDEISLDKDFVLMVVASEVGQPHAIMETHPTIEKHRAIMLTLVPKFQIPRIKPEIIFIVDRSGSMEDKVAQLRNAMTVFLKSLPVGVKFNICSFGSHHTFLWPKSQPYNQTNLDVALKHAQLFEADYGGTEMVPPMEAALKNRYKDLQTEILVLTDGEIWNQQELFDLVQKESQSGDVRVFSLGIGNSVSHSLLEGLARAGNGYAQIVGEKDKLNEKVVRMLKSSLGAHVNNYVLHFREEDKLTSIESRGGDEDFEILDKNEIAKMDEPALNQEKKKISLFDPSVDPDMGDISEHSHPSESEDKFSHLPTYTPPARLQTPYNIPPLYPFIRTTAYVFLSSLSQARPRSIILRGTTTSGDELELEITVTDVGIGTTLHQLAARKLLQELEEGTSYLHSGNFCGLDPVKDEGKLVDWVEREGIRVGTTFGVSGKWTSFVAVDNVSGQLRSLQPEDPEIEESQTEGDTTTLMAFPKRAYAKVNLKSSPSVYTTFRARTSPACYAMPTSAQDLCASPPGTELLSPPPPPSIQASGGNFEVGDTLVTLETLEKGEEMQTAQYDGVVETLDSDTAKLCAETVEEKTYRLMDRQSFDGSFSSTCKTDAWLGKLWNLFCCWIRGQQQEEMNAVVELADEDSQKLLMSAVAVAIFEQELKEMTDVWEMVVEKTMEWGVDVVGRNIWASIRTWVTEQELPRANDF